GVKQTIGSPADSLVQTATRHNGRIQLSDVNVRIFWCCRAKTTFLRRPTNPRGSLQVLLQFLRLAECFLKYSGCEQVTHSNAISINQAFGHGGPVIGNHWDKVEWLRFDTPQFDVSFCQTAPVGLQFTSQWSGQVLMITGFIQRN